MIKLRSRVLTGALAGLLAWQAVLPVMAAEVTDTVETVATEGNEAAAENAAGESVPSVDAATGENIVGEGDTAAGEITIEPAAAEPGATETPAADTGVAEPGSAEASATESTNVAATGATAASADTTETPATKAAAEPVAEVAADSSPAEGEAIVMELAENDLELPPDDWYKDYNYGVNGEREILYLWRYQGSDTEVTIPASAVIEGKTYRTVLRGNVFYERKYMEKLVIEDGVTAEADISHMFGGCYRLASIDFGTLDTSATTSFHGLFAGCASLTELDLSMFDTSGVTEMNTMFLGCSSLRSVNVGSFDTSNVTTMWDMFAGCENLESLDISNFDMSKVKSMDNIFPIGLDHLTLGSGCVFRTSYSGLLGNWTNGQRTCTTAELEQSYNSSMAGTWTRVSYGDEVRRTDERQQASVYVPEGYVSPDRMTDKTDAKQKNGLASDSTHTENGQLVKTAEWTDREAGSAEIDLTYAVPSQGGTKAVFAFGTCFAHGFGPDVAITQMLELLDQYDYLDVITAETQYFWQPGEYMDTARKVTFTLSAADGREANMRRLLSMFRPDFSETKNYNIFHWGSHMTADLLVGYLADYLEENTPAAIYVSLDGSRAYSDNYGIDAESGTKTYTNAVCKVLYGTDCAGLAGKTYDDLQVSREGIRQLAEYQQDGRYYVCLCKEEDYYTVAYFDPESHNTKLMCYASFSIIDPYYFLHHNDELRSYLAGTENLHYTEFGNVGQPIINYGTSFTSQGVEYVSAPLTITDTIADGFTVNKDDVKVSVTLNGKAVSPQPESAVTVEGQNVRIYVPEVSIGEIVSVKIPVKLAASQTAFCTESNAFRNTNEGNAVATTAAGNTVTVGSPKLYKGAYRITTEVVHGTISDSVSNILRGSAQTVGYKPEGGYLLDSVTVDGKAVDTAAYENSYTFANITEDHIIKAVYTAVVDPTKAVTDQKGKDMTYQHFSDGDTVVYSITVTNPSGLTQDITVTDDVPSAISIRKVSDDGKISGQKVTWTLQNVAGHASKTVTITGNAAGTYDLQTVENQALMNIAGYQRNTNKVVFYIKAKERPRDDGGNSGGGSGGNSGGGSHETQIITKVITETAKAEVPTIAPVVEPIAQTPTPADTTNAQDNDINASAPTGGANITTGDDSQMLFYVGIAAMASLVLAGWAVYRKRSMHR